MKIVSIPSPCQYLFQVVLITTPPKAIATDAVTQSGKLANLQIITKEITETSSEDDFIKLLKSIHDFLISPGSEYEESISKQEDATNKENIDDSKMRNNTFRLTERQLHRMIKESVRQVLKENIFDNDYEEIIPLYDIFTNGFTFDNYYREKILLDSSLCYKDGRELGVCLNDLCLKYQPNKNS